MGEAKVSAEPWQLGCKQWSQQNQYLLESGRWADCHFIVGKKPNSKKFGCHKLVLAKASPVFEAMLYRPIDEDETSKEIEIDDVTPQVFQAMLEFLYVDTYSNLEFDMAMQLVYVTEKYMLYALQSLAGDNLMLKLRPENVIKAYEYFETCDTYIFCKFKQRAWKMILECTDEIIAAESFLDAKKSTVLSIVEQDSLFITDESELIEACDKWAQRQAGATQDTKLLRAALGGIFQYLRFLNLSLEDFDSVCKQIYIITKDERSQIRNSILKKQTETFKPGNICLDVTKRIIFKLASPEIHVSESLTNYKIGVGSEYIHSINFSVNYDIALTGIELSFEKEDGICTNSCSCLYNITIRDAKGKCIYEGSQHASKFLRLNCPSYTINVIYTFQDAILITRYQSYNIFICCKGKRAVQLNYIKENKNNDKTKTTMIDNKDLKLQVVYTKIY